MKYEIHLYSSNYLKYFYDDYTKLLKLQIENYYSKIIDDLLSKGEIELYKRKYLNSIHEDIIDVAKIKIDLFIYIEIYDIFIKYKRLFCLGKYLPTINENIMDLIKIKIEITFKQLIFDFINKGKNNIDESLLNDSIIKVKLLISDSLSDIEKERTKLKNFIKKITNSELYYNN